ncbi:hypothetical protein [Micromonospora profundi]|uniref:hypothetical protein n=1 Tax=Micromonospora profundi TaxID=1420889 RepID=UPI00365BE17C
MRYRHFISFSYGIVGGGFGFANTETRRIQPISGHSDVTVIGNDLAERSGYAWAVVLNFQQYPEPRAASDE